MLRPDPAAWQPHRSLGSSTNPSFRDATPIANGVPIVVVVPVAGLSRWRLRAKTSGGGAGTWSFAYLRPAPASGTTRTAYTVDNPANVVHAANTEQAIEEATHYGEGEVQITFTPSASGVLDFADFSGV